MKPSDKAIAFVAKYTNGLADDLEFKFKAAINTDMDCDECGNNWMDTLTILMLRALAKWADDSIERRLVRLVYCQGGCLVTAGKLFENGAFKIQTEYEAALAAVELAAEME